MKTRTTITTFLCSMLMLFSFATYAQDWLPAAGMGLDDDPKDMIAVNGVLYIGGKFNQVDGQNIPYIAMYDGTSWQAVGTGLNYRVECFAAYNGNLVAFGGFDKDGSGAIDLNNGVAMWDGTTWSPMGTTTILNSTDAIVWNGDLYVTYNAPDSNGIMKWDGTDWVAVPGTFKGPNNYREAGKLAVYNNELICVGRYDSVGTVPANMVAAWDGTNWKNIGFPEKPREGNLINGYARGVGVYDGKLFVGGLFTDFQDTLNPSVATWDGTNWKGYSFDGNIAHEVRDFAEFNGDWFVGGEMGYWNCDFTDLVGSVVLWDSLATNHFTDLKFFNSQASKRIVNAMTVFNGSLYVAGRITHAGSAEVNGVTKFDGNIPLPSICDSNSTASIHDLEIVETKLYPNPSHGTVYLEINDANNGQYTLSVMDLLGRQVYLRNHITNGKININGADLPSGILIYEVRGEDKVVGRGKLQMHPH